MNIELENVKVYPKLSEETTCFSADVYIDGILTATAQNRGNGGCTDIHPVTRDARDTVEKAEKYAQTLPPLVGKDYTLPMSLDFYIDCLATVHDAAKNRTNKKNGFIMWKEAKKQVHDASGQDYPEFCLWLKSNGAAPIYYPQKAV